MSAHITAARRVRREPHRKSPRRWIADAEFHFRNAEAALQRAANMVSDPATHEHTMRLRDAAERMKDYAARVKQLPT